MRSAAGSGRRSGLCVLDDPPKHRARRATDLPPSLCYSQKDIPPRGKGTDMQPLRIRVARVNKGSSAQKPVRSPPMRPSIQVRSNSVDPKPIHPTAVTQAAQLGESTHNLLEQGGIVSKPGKGWGGGAGRVVLSRSSVTVGRIFRVPYGQAGLDIALYGVGIFHKTPIDTGVFPHPDYVHRQLSRLGIKAAQDLNDA